MEPGDTEVTRERTERIVAIVKDMIRQDRSARIILGGDINGQLANLHKQLSKCGFRAGLEPGTQTHQGGNHLDQLWVRNLQIKNTLVSESHDPSVTDHCCIKATIEIKETYIQAPAE